jgi:hypothetical protein
MSVTEMQHHIYFSCGCDFPFGFATPLGIHTPDLRWSQSHPILDDIHTDRYVLNTILSLLPNFDGIKPLALDAKKAGFAPLQSKSLIVAWKKAVHMLYP